MQPAASKFDISEIFTRIVKYLVEGLVVGIVAMILPKKPLSLDEAVLIALVAAAMFSILDLVAPSIASSARFGAGASMGVGLIGL